MHIKLRQEVIANLPQIINPATLKYYLAFLWKYDPCPRIRMFKEEENFLKIIISSFSAINEKINIYKTSQKIFVKLKKNHTNLFDSIDSSEIDYNILQKLIILQYCYFSAENQKILIIFRFPNIQIIKWIEKWFDISGIIQTNPNDEHVKFIIKKRDSVINLLFKLNLAEQGLNQLNKKIIADHQHKTKITVSTEISNLQKTIIYSTNIVKKLSLLQENKKVWNNLLDQDKLIISYRLKYPVMSIRNLCKLIFLKENIKISPSQFYKKTESFLSMKI